jgi:hypothetical protein
MQEIPQSPSGDDIAFKALYIIELRKTFKKQKKTEEIDSKITALDFANCGLKQIADSNELKKKEAKKLNPEIEGLNEGEVKEKREQLINQKEALRKIWKEAKIHNDPITEKKTIDSRKEIDKRLLPIETYLLACKSKAFIERELESNLRMIAELQEKVQKLSKKQIKKEFEEIYDSLGEYLSSLPYTFTQAHLKSMFGETNEKKCLKDILENTWVAKQIKGLSILSEEDEDKFIEVLSEILQKEQEFNSRFACYHSMEPQIGNVYDFYTAFNSLLLLVNNSSPWSFRGHADKKKSETIHGLWHIAETKQALDESPEFRIHGISAVPSLFTNFDAFTESAFASWISGGGLNSLPDNFIKNFYLQLGFPEKVATERSKEVEEVFATSPRHPRLLQFLIHPAVIDEIAYVSLGFGSNLKVVDWFEEEGFHSIKPSHILPPYRKAEETDKIDSLQLRLLYNPEIMSQTRFVTQFYYFASKDDKELRAQFAHYQENLNQLVAKHVGEWLENYSGSEDYKLTRIKNLLNP